jgi:hypothetical protein
MKAVPTGQSLLHPYARISDPEQRKGGGLERQTQADVETFAKQFGFKISNRVLVDDGVSAWKGLNATPRHQLGQFLGSARQGIVPPGDCLLLENYDRLSRQDPWAAIGLVSELRQLGIHIGRLDRMKLLRCDSTDPGDFFEASIEFIRGNSESNAKSFRNGAAWDRKRKAAREASAPMTKMLPAWIQEKKGKLALIPARAAAVRRILALWANGFGPSRIVKRLIEEGVAPMGRTGAWTRSYICKILKDRRVIGELQPCKIDGTPDGKPIADYYPAAATEAEFYAALARSPGKRQKAGRIGERVELFSGLIKDARDGGGYLVGSHYYSGKAVRILLNTNSAERGTPAYSFPLPTFEAAVLRMLKEISPREILAADSGPDETIPLSAELASVEAKIADLEAELLKGDVSAIGNVLRRLEARQRELAEQLAAACEEAAHPLSESWGEAQTLTCALEKANDNKDVRLRLRAALRRIVDEIRLLVVPRGKTRLAAVQIWFKDGKHHRDYLIMHRGGQANAATRTERQWWARSLAEVVRPGALDLRKRKDVARLEAALTSLAIEA